MKAMNWQIEERRDAVDELRNNFANLPDKKQAWEDLIRLTQEGKFLWLPGLVNGHRFTVPHIPDEELPWEDLHRQTQDEERCVLAANYPVYISTYVYDKKRSGVDLIRTRDENSVVKWQAACSLGIVFPYVHDKIQAWKDLHLLTQKENSGVRWGATYSLCSAFSHIPDKKQAWDDIIRLTRDENSHVQLRAAYSLGVVFPYAPNKIQAWKDLIKLTQDRNKGVKRVKLQDRNKGVRGVTTESLGLAFPHLPDKKRAWKGLHRLAQDKENFVRRQVAYSMGVAFPHIPDKKQAWEDIIQLTRDKDSVMRRCAAESLGLAFPHMPDKKEAWEDLHQLMRDEYSDVRQSVSYILGSVFPHITDKKQAWDDLIRLARDTNSDVRRRATESLGAAFPHVSDKKQAWEDMRWLAQDEESSVRWGTAYSMGAAFPYIPDKKQAWYDLIRLGQDKNGAVRVSANYSLGKASIYKATEAESEEDFRKELEKALEFFEISSKEAIYYYPAKFCLPFYRSFHAITFQKQNTEAEVQKYLAEAKSASEGSESKEKLLEAVDNLANALKEAQRARDFDEVKCDLNTYRRYCERAAEIMGVTEVKAPSATKVLKRGLPIIDKKIKELLGGIADKTKKFCKESRQTPFEKISRSAYDHVKGLGEVKYPIEAEKRLNKLSPLLRSICAILPEESRGMICNQLDEIEEADLSDKARIIESALSSIHVQIRSLQQKLDEKNRWIEYLKDLVLNRLNNINYSVFQLKLRSGEMVPALLEIQGELNKLKTIKTDFNNIGLSLTDLGNLHLQHYDFHSLNDDITRLSREIETEVIPKLPQTSDIQRILEKLQDLKQTKKEDWFNRAAGLSSILGLVLTILKF